MAEIDWRKPEIKLHNLLLKYINQRYSRIVLKSLIFFPDSEREEKLVKLVASLRVKANPRRLLFNSR